METLSVEPEDGDKPDRSEDERVCGLCDQHPVDTWVQPPYLLGHCQACFPYEIYWLQELVFNGCPDEPLKVFRKSLIGKKKPLNAKQADAAIKGARDVMATGELTDKRHLKHAARPETMDEKISRLNWYLEAGMPVVIARHRFHEFTAEECWLIEAARDLECDIIYLQWDKEAVDKVESIDIYA